MIQVAFKLALIAQFGLLSVSSTTAHWEECPTDFSVYTGCNVNVEAVFCSKNHSGICQDHTYDVVIGDHDSQKPDGKELVTTCTFNETVNNENMTIHNETGCKVNVTIDMITTGKHNVTFYAAPDNGEVPEYKHCRDLIKTEDTISPPSSIESKVNCDNFTLTWSAPSVLQGYHIHGYSINITNAENNEFVYNYVISGNDTSIEIDHRNLFTPDKEYRVDIRTLYCGGTSNESAMHTFGPINMAPKVSEHLTYYQISSSMIEFKANVIDVNCPLSHPTSVEIQFSKCDGDSEQNTDVTSIPVAIANNGDIKFKANHTSGSTCKVSLKWMNAFESSISNIRLSMSDKEFFRGYFLAHNKLKEHLQLKVTNYVCSTSCCCIANSDGTCSDPSVRPCDVHNQPPEYNITHILLYHNDQFSCDGSYSLSCENGTVEKTSDECKPPGSSSVPQVTSITPSATNKETSGFFKDDYNWFSFFTTILIVILLICLIVLAVLGMALQKYFALNEEGKKEVTEWLQLKACRFRHK